MKLLTKDIIKKLEKRGRIEEYKDSDPIITKLNYTEWGYFTLSELEEVELPFGLGIERDKSFKGTYADIKVN